MLRIIPLLLCLVFAACSSNEDDAQQALTENLIFVAVEEDGALAVINGDNGELVTTVDLTETLHGSSVAYDVHNVQSSPDGETVWLTAMPLSEGGGHGGEEMMEQLVGISSRSFSIIARIELGSDLHVAHVVISEQTAYVTAYESDRVLVVDLENETLADSILLPEGTSPHGARVTRDGMTLVVAGMGDGSMHVINTQTKFVNSYDLPGRAVQAAITPDDLFAFATIYDTRQIAKLDLTTRALSLFDMQEGSAGPVQLYPSLDGQSLWIADQGLLEGQPAGDKLVQMNAATGDIMNLATVDPAPHGVVVNQDGSRVWTTTLINGTVQSVDPVSGTVLSTTEVGNGPNGISCRHLGAAMP